jgi:hypothetical protein
MFCSKKILENKRGTHVLTASWQDGIMLIHHHYQAISGAIATKLQTYTYSLWHVVTRGPLTGFSF